MLYQITDGTVSMGGHTILSHIDFEIRGNEKIAVVGRNGAGKTTLLRLIAGELELDRDDKRTGPGIERSRKLSVELLKQQTFADTERTVEEELLAACPCRDTFDKERFEYEQEYDALFTGFGFEKKDKRKKIREFSGGEQTKIALIRLLLAKPDILLLDEPTNHLDLETSEWLERYLKRYEKAVVEVSHDRFFLDRTADVVYELTGKRLVRYPGNYSHYREEKGKNIRLQAKAYERQQEEIKRLEDLVERFKHKPKKASFARSKKKAIERMAKVDAPEADDSKLFTGQIEPLVPGNKWVFEAEHLKIGYEKTLLEISIRIRKGQKIGLLGANGVGKTTFLKTIAGLTPPLTGDYSLGNAITIGYFDQHSAEISSEKSVMEHFHDLFPALTEKEARSILGAYLFGGKDAGKKVDSLSGGEKARLVLAELLQSRPNFLILDEPTNHMDIQAKETLESAFQAYQGTILFVSHDRYFIRQVADAILIFENQGVMYYPFGYEHYLERREKLARGGSIPAQIKAEEQALIAGMQAVPKAERHRLREISTEDAYMDWRLRLAGEKLKLYEARVETLAGELEAVHQAWRESEAFWADEGRERSGSDWAGAGWGRRSEADWAGAGWERRSEAAWTGAGWEREEEANMLAAAYENAWKEWHDQCLEWYESIGKELHQPGAFPEKI